VRVAVTGASGFIGRHLSDRLESSGFEVRRLVRSAGRFPGGFTVGDIEAPVNLNDALDGVTCVVHLAARVHVLREHDDPLGSFRRANVRGTELLARSALERGTKRFVFVSSLGVLGNRTTEGASLNSTSLPAPKDPYSVSKLEAERTLENMAERDDLELVIVRPCMVYGPQAPGNFARATKLLAMRAPLPFASINNRRAMIGIDNLVDLIVLCITHSEAPGNAFLAADHEQLSTPAFFTKLGEAMGKPARLFRCPTELLSLLGKLAGMGADVQRLVGSLQVDTADTRRILGWAPELSIDQGLRRAFAS
jgi:nucleoside-diphosphate-sugar epimerase